MALGIPLFSTFFVPASFLTSRNPRFLVVTFCSRYLNGIKTRFTKHERNDDTIQDDEVISEFEIFKQKVLLLGVSSVQHPQQFR